MPQLEICTNISSNQMPKNFNLNLTNLLATIQNKPSSLTLISVKPDQLITFGGTDEPCALITIQSIGNQSADENRKSCSQIFQFIENELKISSKRIFINYFDLQSKNVAWNGKIFEDILPKSDS